jgi:hypothetical protein
VRQVEQSDLAEVSAAETALRAARVKRNNATVKSQEQFNADIAAMEKLKSLAASLNTCITSL